MLPRIRRRIFPPVLPDEDQARTAALLNTILLAALAVMGIYFVIQVLFDPHLLALLFVALFAVVLGGIWALLRRGSVRAASFWFCFITFAGMALAAWIFGGVQSSSYSALILTVILAGILLGGRAAMILAALSTVWGLILTAGEINGWYVPQAEYLSLFNAWLGQALAFGLAALLLGLTSRSIRTAQALARDSQRQLADSHDRLQQRTQELEEQRAQLVQERDLAARLKEQYRNFIEQSVEGIWRLEFDQPIPTDLPPEEQVRRIQQTGYIAECNDALARMYGYPSHESLVGRRLLELYGEQPGETNFNATLALVNAGYRAGNRGTQEVNSRGEPVYFLNTASGIIERGQVRALWGMQRDVTELKRTEQALRTSEARLRALLSAIPDFIFEIRQDGVFQDVVPTAHEELAISPEAFLGRKIQDVLPLEVALPAQYALEQALQTGLMHTFEYELRLSGTAQEYEARVVPSRADAALTIVRNITRRKQAERALARRMRQFQAVAEVSRAMTSILDLDELLPQIVELLRARFDLYYAGLFLLDESEQQAVLRAGTGEAGRAMLAAEHRLPVAENSMIGWCIIHAQARIALDVGAEPDRFANAWLPHTRSEMALPLISRGRVIGTLTIQSDQPSTFTADDIAVLQTMADQVSTAIDNARLFEIEKRSAALMTALRDMGLNLSAQLDLPELLRSIMRQAAQLLDAPMGELLLLQPDGRTLKEVANYQSPPEDQLFIVPIGEGASGRVALTGEPLIVDDYLTWPGRIKALEVVGYRSVLSVPIKWQGRVLGVITLQDHRPQRFNSAQANQLQLFAVQAAVAIENARLFEITQRWLNELKVLHGVAVAASEAATVEQLLDQEMEIIGRALFHDYAGVLLKDESLNILHGRLYQAGAHVPLAHDTVPLGSGIVGRVAVTGRSWLIPDVRLEPAYMALNPDVLSELCVPIRVGDRLIGVIDVESRALAAFTTADEQLLGTIAGQLGTAIERLRSEEALARERNLLRMMIDNLNDTHVFVKDTASRFVTTNAAHLRTMGLTGLDQVVGKTERDFLPAELADQYLVDERMVIQTGQPMLNRVELVRDANGVLHWYLTNKVPLHDRTGAIIGLVGVSLNITERKQAEERERAIARSLRAVVEAANELIRLDDLNLLYRRAVELARDNLGLERCAIYMLDETRAYLQGTFGTNPHGSTTDERAVRFPSSAYPQLLLPTLPFWVVQEGKHSYWDGQQIRSTGVGWIAVTAVRTGDETIGVFFNDTAITHAPLDEILQEALAVFCSLLGNIIVRKRVAQEREGLIKELEGKNAELERFTYTVSHDLKSPLITIRGFLGFLERDAVAGNLDRLRADIARITDATDKMQRLLSDLLELSRIGRLTNPPQAVPFGTIAREAVDLVAGRLLERGVRVEIAPDLPAVFVDRVRLVEAVQNLADNAAKFMGDQSEPRIEIGVRRDKGELVFFVRDNGLGIEPRFHDKVFGLFDKLDSQSEGTGVGLALVKRIIAVHGGRIWVESAGRGHGATFCFTLPLASA